MALTLVPWREVLPAGASSSTQLLQGFTSSSASGQSLFFEAAWPPSQRASDFGPSGCQHAPILNPQQLTASCAWRPLARPRGQWPPAAAANLSHYLDAAWLRKFTLVFRAKLPRSASCKPGVDCTRPQPAQASYQVALLSRIVLRFASKVDPQVRASIQSCVEPLSVEKANRASCAWTVFVTGSSLLALRR